MSTVFKDFLRKKGITHMVGPANTQQYLPETKGSKEESVLNTRNQLLQIILNKHGLKNLDENTLSIRARSQQLAVGHRSISKHRNNKVPFKKMQASKKNRVSQKRHLSFNTITFASSWCSFGTSTAVQAPIKRT